MELVPTALRKKIGKLNSNGESAHLMLEHKLYGVIVDMHNKRLKSLRLRLHSDALTRAA